MRRIGLFDLRRPLLILALMLLSGLSFASQTRSLRGNFIKNGPPPCKLPEPNFDFMKEDSPPFSIPNMTSAAWFARQVQLTSGLRSEAWQNLPTKPQRVIDFQADPWGLHATILEFEQQVLVLYRGTEDVLDYALNATFNTTRKGEELGLPGWVHEGFLTNFRLTWKRIFEALKETSGHEKSIVFAAHSLGGVLSQFAAYLAENAGLKVIRIFTFQSPHAGDVIFKKSFEEKFEGRHSNTLYGDDVTPHIPPIAESADVFAEAALRPLGGVLSKILKKARYGALDGRFLIHSSGDSVRIPADAIVQQEMEYWSSYRSKSGGKGFPLGLTPESSFLADHDIDRVLCALARLR